MVCIIDTPSNGGKGSSGGLVAMFFRFDDGGSHDIFHESLKDNAFSGQLCFLGFQLREPGEQRRINPAPVPVINHISDCEIFG